VTAFILPTLTSYAPARTLDLLAYPHLQNLQFADPDLFGDEQIDLLIGDDNYGSIILDGLRQGQSSNPIAQRTIFGWIVFEPFHGDSLSTPRSLSSLHCSISTSIAILLKQF